MQKSTALVFLLMSVYCFSISNVQAHHDGGATVVWDHEFPWNDDNNASDDNIVEEEEPIKVSIRGCASRYSKKECQFFKLTNKTRKRHGLRALKHYQNCAKAAKFHAKNMSRLGVFEHDIPGIEGGSFFDRLIMFDIDGGAENLHLGHTRPDLALKSLMGSPGHRRQILNDEFKGLGVAQVGRYWVQCFSF